MIKAEIPYLSKFTFNKRILATVGSAADITIEGFEFTHIDKNSVPLIVHVDGYASHDNPTTVTNITLRNNIFHDRFNNDLLKIKNDAKKIKEL